MIEVRVVTIRDICNACHIVEGVVREMMEKVSRKLDIEVQWTVYQDPNDAMNFPGLEMPKFPALFINGEQYTAGEIPDVFSLREWLIEAKEGE